MITQPQTTKGLMHYHFTGSGLLIVSLLTFALIGLGERVLYDLARLLVGENIDYFDNLQVIGVHAIFIILLLIVSTFINLLAAEKKEKYALALIPYFILSIVLAMQLALQVGVYFSYHHTQLEFYVVMTALVAVCSYAIYFIQNRYNPET